MGDEDRLRRALSKLRDQDAKTTPSFDELARRGRPTRSGARWALVVPLASAAAAAAVLVVWCRTETITGSASAPMAAAPAAAAAPAPPSDPAPLDFLLDLPGSSALAAASSLDTSALSRGVR